MNLARRFVHSAEKNSSKAAVFWGEDELTYRQILHQSLWFAQRLQRDFGVRSGDRVGLWLKNCPEFIAAFFGVLHASAAVTPINNFLKPDEVAYILADAGINVIISDEGMHAGLAELQARLPGLQVVHVDGMRAASETAVGPFPHCDRTKQDLAVIIYTSGTTGHPKGAMLTHGNLIANVESCRQVLEAVDADRFVLLLPMFHSFMMTVSMLLPLTVGGSIVLIKSLHPAKNILAEIVHRQATLLPAIPQFFRTLAHTPLDFKLPLRVCVSGAAPLPVEILKEFHDRMNIPLIEGYGLSEASPVCSINPIRGQAKAGSIGLPIPDVKMSVQDEDGQHLPDYQVGEICVRGENVMEGYWNRPDETAKAIKAGWLLTGDVGYRDSEGYYYITDRKKDMLLVNGINVYPREIEEVMYQFPGVREAAVIGEHDSRKGEHPIAFVSMNEGATLVEKDLLAFVRSRLADYKIPRRVHVMPALPRNATGKILKTTLRSLPKGG